MRLDFFISPDPWQLARRYAIVSGFRGAWLLLMTFDPQDFFAGFVPLQLSGLFGMPYLISGAMLLVQFGLIFGLAYSLWLHFSRPAEETDPNNLLVDAAKLERPWWSTVLTLSAALLPTLYIAAAIIIRAMENSRWRNKYSVGLADYVNSAGTVPLLLTLAFAALGMIFGFAKLSQARGQSTERLGVKFLADDYWLTKRVHHYAAQLNLPPPAVGIMNAVNAYAVGTTRSDAAVVIGVPLARHLSMEELDAVICHELGHIASGDMRRLIIAEGYQSMFGSVFAFFASLLTAVAASGARSRSDARLNAALGDSLSTLGRSVIFLGGELIVKGLSRSREFYADAIGASLTSPEAMKGALEKLSKIPTAPTPAESEYGYLMFKGPSFLQIFSTHPPTEKRAEALEKRTHINALPRR